jgi:hypothetical protein
MCRTSRFERTDLAVTAVTLQPLFEYGGEHSETSLLELCPPAEINIDVMQDEGPGSSDTYFSNYSEDVDALKQEVKQVVEAW